MARKILLMSMNVGGGHTALRDAFATSLQRLDPEGTRFEVMSIESRDEATLAFYKWVVRYLTPFQWVVHRFSDSELVLRMMMFKERQGLVVEAEELLRTHQPDVVVSTHLILTAALVYARNRLGSPAKVLTAIPDYGEPTSGFFPGRPSIRPDGAIAMEEVAHRAVVGFGHAPAERILLGGFLPRQPFELQGARLGDRRRLPPEERAALARSLVTEFPQLEAYDASRPTLIFLGGSAWTEKTLPVLERVLADRALADATNLLVVAGNNPEFHADLVRRTRGHATAMPFGFLAPEVLATLLALSDVPVLGSLAPATLHELLELRVGPLLLFHYIPGTEGPHVDYLHAQRLGLYEPDPDRMIHHVREALGHAPPSGPLRALMDGFGPAAAALREAHRERALALGPFLEQFVPDREAAAAEGLRVAS
ncbi:MAG TPA: hypothetical protein VK013_07720 [Myxococcaceae bacterium]|nr:hypothetical protein [Myxococcaceae bacterium]